MYWFMQYDTLLCELLQNQFLIIKTVKLYLILQGYIVWHINYICMHTWVEKLLTYKTLTTSVKWIDNNQEVAINRNMKIFLKLF